MISSQSINKISYQQKNLKGIFPIIYSFFNKNNSLDIKLMKEQIQFIKKIGSNGIACLGLATPNRLWNKKI